jgi:osmotically-inducible protein OsmY
MNTRLSIYAIAAALAAGPALATDPPNADNSARNVRDRHDKTLTPMDQGGSEADRELTAAIRRALVADDSLSTDAHNVKIITQDQVVTLRGPVKNTAEKAAVAAKAQQARGVKRVDNQLEVKTQ